MSRSNAQVQALLDAVRRHLWWIRLMLALRSALWVSTGLMLLVVAVHLAVGPVAFGSALLALAGLWAAALAWASGQRPRPPACALWADRHLGGACAFTTLLERGAGQPEETHAGALQWLEYWASAKASQSMRVLAEHKAPARLSRPLLSLVVCLALAAAVLQLPGVAPSSPQAVAGATPSTAAGLAGPAAGAFGAAERTGDVAHALRATATPGLPDRRQTAATAAAGPGVADRGQGLQPAPADAASADMRPGERVTGADASLASTAKAGAKPVSGAGAGREAGDSRDDAAERGVTRVPRATMSVQRSSAGAGRDPALRQADMGRLGTYTDGPSIPGTAGMQTLGTPAAAKPPAATEAMRLSATEASYVQAWMKVNGERR